jgi:hypothetical protein
MKKKRLFYKRRIFILIWKYSAKEGILIHGDSYLKYENYEVKDFMPVL